LNPGVWSPTNWTNSQRGRNKNEPQHLPEDRDSHDSTLQFNRDSNTRQPRQSGFTHNFSPVQLIRQHSGTKEVLPRGQSPFRSRGHLPAVLARNMQERDESQRQRALAAGQSPRSRVAFSGVARASYHCADLTHPGQRQPLPAIATNSPRSNPVIFYDLMRRSRKKPGRPTGKRDHSQYAAVIGTLAFVSYGLYRLMQRPKPI